MLREIVWDQAEAFRGERLGNFWGVGGVLQKGGGDQKADVLQFLPSKLAVLPLGCPLGWVEVNQLGTITWFGDFSREEANMTCPGCGPGWCCGNSGNPSGSGQVPQGSPHLKAGLTLTFKELLGIANQPSHRP